MAFKGHFTRRPHISLGNEGRTQLQSHYVLPSTQNAQSNRPEESYDLDDYLDYYAENIEILSSPSPPDRTTEPVYPMDEEQDEIEYENYHTPDAIYYQPQHRNQMHVSNASFPTRVVSSESISSVQLKSNFNSMGVHQNFNTSDHNYREQDTWNSGTDVDHGEGNVETRIEVPRNTHGIRLRPVSSLPDMYRGIFKFGVFNAVQSSCFDYIINSNGNMVASAPTGSGKTVLFELAIIRMLSLPENVDRSLKCVYMAPTKALCSERYRDWTAKFDPLGIKCAELTGDTVHFGKGVWGDAKKASIIITTGEKWDSLTRNWGDHSQILSQIQLLLVDEVHILNESRGSTLEVVVSRMRTRGSSVRFLFISATVPNIHDLAAWVGSGGKPDLPAKVFEFGEEFRPCKLTRFVIGVPRPRGQNDFAFNKSLDYRLFATLQQHSAGKPILVFCSTRKGVFTTAEQLMKEYLEAELSKKPLPWSHPKKNGDSFHDKRLNDFASVGIGVHHAGITLDDRKMAETLYLNGSLRIIVATSTLAVGVNLPAHMVVIKGVQTFQNNTSVEYSDLDIMQMLGRAGRPQFDKDGIAVIICEVDLEQKYRTLVQGKTILESTLHYNLAEHLNSEIGLKTITSISTAKEWLRGSFLFQRLRKNPSHYSLGKDDNQTWEERVDDLVMQSVEKLRQTQLVETPVDGTRGGELVSTDFGDIMSKLYIRQSTMGLILALPERPSLRDILETISCSEELAEVKLRASEKTALNKLRRHPDIRFEIKRLEKTADKVFLLIQAVLAGISLNSAEYKSVDSQPQLEAFSIFRHVGRISRAIVEVGVYKQLGAQVKNGLELLRCLTAKAWEDRPVVLRQIEQIGEKSIKAVQVLAEHGIVSIPQLLKQDAFRLETLLNRRPPFGLELLMSANELPQYSLVVSETLVTSNGGKGPVEVDLSVQCGLNQFQDNQRSKSKRTKGISGGMTVVLTLSSDMELFDYRRIATKSLKEKKAFAVTVELTRPSQSVTVLITSETVAGLSISQSYKPAVSPKEFPTRNTRPPSTIDIDLDGLEDDPDFWNMDAGEEVLPVVRDLTNPSGKAKGEGIILSSNKNEALLRNLDRVVCSPKKLPNGNYECNHLCKNKDKCRHLCCRDGVPEKPKKRSSSARPSLNSPKGRQNLAPGETTLPKTSTRKAKDRRLEKLESLHERTNVSSNLKLLPGHRLKLEPPSELGEKDRQPMLKINDCTDSKGLPSVEKAGYDSIELDDSDEDDLPEAPGMFHRHQTQTPASDYEDYSNSDIDSLIRAATLDDISTTHVGERKRKYTAEPPMAATKRVRTDYEEPRPTPSILNDNASVPTTTTYRASRSQDDQDTCQPEFEDIRENLFLPSISDEFQDIPDDYEPFDNQFHSDSVFLRDDNSCTSKSLDMEANTSDLTLSSRILGQPGVPDSDSNLSTTKNEDEDDFAELDAWLNSGAVEIL